MHFTLLVTRDGADVVLLELGAAEVTHSGGYGAMHGRMADCHVTRTKRFVGFRYHGVLHGDAADAVAEALANEGEITAVHFHLMVGGTLLRNCRITQVRRFLSFRYEGG